MTNLRKRISERLSDALIAWLGEEGRSVDSRVQTSQDPRFGDYQSNCAMGLAKKLHQKPRDVAADIIAHLKIDDLCEPPEIAGAGFINFKIKNDFLAKSLSEIPAQSDRLGIVAVSNPQVVVVDMSSPNLAKEMHVGHLRPTIIGDAIARILEFQGHTVHRLNHIGDWGTQFGMLIQYLIEKGNLLHWVHAKGKIEKHGFLMKSPGNDSLLSSASVKIDDLEQFYINAKEHFDKYPDFAERSRKCVVGLQSGDRHNLILWEVFCRESLCHCHEIYELLGVKNLIDRGESFYNDMLPVVVKELKDKGVAVESEGAICIFPEGFKTREGNPLPLIIQKSDGGYGYATTDLAALKHRITEMNADRIIYVVGNQQKQHFEMLFAALRMTGWTQGRSVETVHLPTGMLLRDDGAPFKTREGGTVKLKDLLTEAVERSKSFLLENEKNSDKARGYTPEQIDHMAQIIGIASVKYFELLHNLGTDYRFDWNEMLSLDGNTAPYMLYAYARVQSILRKAELSELRITNYELRTTNDERRTTILEHPAEIAMAKMILKFTEVLELLERELRPSVLTEYLFDLSKTFSTFYDRKTGVRVIDAQPDSVRSSRLQLCELTGRLLHLGLNLLGISTLDRM